MAHLDKFLTVLVSHRGDALQLATDDVASLRVAGQSRPLSRQTFTTPQIVSLLREIAPVENIQHLESGNGTSFAYANPDGAFATNAKFADGRLTVVMRPEAPPTPAAGTNGGAHANADGARVRVTGSDTARAEMEGLLRQLVSRSASDLHLRVGEPPIFRVHGEITREQNVAPVTNEKLEAMLASVMPERNRAEFASSNDTDFAYEIEGLARFRCNALRDRRGVAAVCRVIPAAVITVEELGLSEEIRKLCLLSRGLVLVTGPTGSGKSTTLCALIDLVNRVRNDHVITIEDPIEFVHQNRSCLITQRQVGVHTTSFKSALRAALREDPDIILVGELRDLETVSIAIETAETGHLVFGTLHTTTAASTIDRLIDQFPSDGQAQIRTMLSDSLKGVISQTLCKKIGGGRVAAREVLLSIPAVSNLIREGKTFQIPSVMQTSRRFGMVTLNDALIELVDGKQVEPKEAYSKSVDRITFANMLKQRGHDVSFLDVPEGAAAAPGGVKPAGKPSGRP